MKHSAAYWFEIILIVLALMFALAVMAALIAAPAHAQVVCGPREQVLTVITGPRYTEARMVDLPSVTGAYVMRLYGNPGTGTWTLLAFPDTVQACIVASGKGMVMLAPEIPGTPL